MHGVINDSINDQLDRKNQRKHKAQYFMNLYEGLGLLKLATSKGFGMSFYITSNFQHTMQTQHCSQFLHTRQTIPAMLNSNYIGYEVSFIPTKCFIRKKPTFRLLFCNLHQSIHSSVLCMLCML